MIQLLGVATGAIYMKYRLKRSFKQVLLFICLSLLPNMMLLINLQDETVAIVYGLGSVVITLMAYEDLLTKEVPLELILVLLSFGITYRIIYIEGTWIQLGIELVILAGIILLCYIGSRRTIGIGDLLLMGSLYPLLGLYQCLFVISFGLVIGGVMGIGLLVVKKAHKRTTLPYIPFVWLAFCIMIIL